MVLIAEWVRLARNNHESWAELTETGAHWLIEAAEPRRKVVLIVMIVEHLKHMPYFVELIDITIVGNSWGCFVRVADFCSDIKKMVPCHEAIQAEWSARVHVARISRPPQLAIRNPLKAQHNELATKPLI